MADIVNAQATGYDKLDTLKKVHEKILKELNQEISDTKGLLGEKNGFYADSTCKKITILLETLEKEILPEIKDSFTATEKSITSMEGILMNNDYL